MSDPKFIKAARLHKAGCLREALDAYRPFLVHPELGADAASNLSALSMQMGDPAGAEDFARRAISLNPGHANAWNHLGLALKTRNAMKDAGTAFGKAVSFDPQHAPAFANLAEVRVADDDIAGAVQCYENALRIEPELTIALVGYVHRKQQIASWGGLDSAIARLSRQIARGEPAVDPFILLFCCTEPDEILKACRNAAKAREARVDNIWGKNLFHHPRQRHARIRVGYVSGNFYDHAVGTLICQLLESHDSEGFEIFCYCHSPVKTGARRERIKRAAHHFIEIDGLDDLVAAKRIHQDGIDILVDLMGYTKGHRLGIFSLRPSPVQVTWIGFPGSSGGRSADYIIADPVVIPPADDRFYDEKPVRMPVCYQVNDANRRLSDQTMTREQYGIPDDSIVFCNFNQTAKITPPVADLWAAIMGQVPDSVLWLWSLFDEGASNLRGELVQRGIPPTRIHFGSTLPDGEHLARYALCDLFLDSFPYCGHATASNALFGSCPVLSFPAKTFASRVSASLLTALNLKELIAASPQDYVRKAVALARDRPKLKKLKQYLVAARTASPLFDGARFARDIEQVYRVMMQRHWIGEVPLPIEFDRSSSPGCAVAKAVLPLKP